MTLTFSQFSLLLIHSCSFFAVEVHPDESGYVCSTHATVASSIVVVVVIFVLTLLTFGLFYRRQRRLWMRKTSYHRGGATVASSSTSLVPTLSARVHPGTSGPDPPPPPVPARYFSPDNSDGFQFLSILSLEHYKIPDPIFSVISNYTYYFLSTTVIKM